MVKVIGPLHSTEARGVIGGLVANTWRGIRYFKRMTSPAQPRTSRSLALRSITVHLVRYWQTLSSTVQGQWNDYSAEHPVIDWTGVAIRLTGCNWFVGLSARLMDWDTAFPDTPPVVAAPEPLFAFDAADGTEQTIVTWTPVVDLAMGAEIWLYGPHSAGKLGKIERAKLYTRLSANLGTLTIDNLLPGTYTVFGRVISSVDGQVSTWSSDSALVSAAP